ncbi:hypothetical protein [Bryobacter aggregatus]|uniref:hypothetical protein n=1 Tax=Bryobacter aggregatus TaxID=360054 RepID=UPI0004E0E66D|nr:hypothetical protein [Bryobacter aggregatus]
MDFEFDFDDPESDLPAVAPELLTPQEMVDLFARKAKPRLLELLKLKVPHLYDETPGRDGAITATTFGDLRLKLQRTSQPYRGMDRFANEEKVLGFVINPGLLPIVKAMTFASQGKRLVVTRKIAPANSDKGAVADVDGFGIRVLLRFDAETEEHLVVWEWLSGVI